MLDGGKHNDEDRDGQGEEHLVLVRRRVAVTEHHMLE